MKIERYTIALSDGRIAECEYDPTGDLLEVYLQRHEASATVELTPNVVLRFDWARCEPLSLGIISFSTLIPPSPYANMPFDLLVEEWPEAVYEKVLSMLRRSPLSEILSLQHSTSNDGNVFTDAVMVTDLLKQASILETA